MAINCKQPVTNHAPDPLTDPVTGQMWLHSGVVSCLYQHHEMQNPLQCYNYSCVACSMFLFDFLPINVMVVCLDVDQVSGAPFWHFRRVIGMYRARGSFVLLSARNVAPLWVRLHSDLSNSGASGQFGILRDTSGHFGTRRAMPVACSVQVLLFLIRWLGHVTVDI
jgi:hypothetical protein